MPNRPPPCSTRISAFIFSIMVSMLVRPTRVLSSGWRFSTTPLAKRRPAQALFPDEAHFNILRRVGIFEDVGGDIVQNPPDVLPLDREQQVFLAQFQRAGKAALLQRVHQLGERLLKDRLKNSAGGSSSATVSRVTSGSTRTGYRKAA